MSILTKYNLLLNNKKVSFIKFISVFSNDNECLELYFNLKYCDQPCKKCGRGIILNYNRVKRIDKNGVQKKSFRCKSCHTHIYPLSDTIFKKTSVPLRNIFIMLYYFAHSKKNYSAANMAIDLPISYKTVHKLMMAIRETMYDDLGRKFKGTVEIDEVFIGKGRKFYNWSGISTRKQPIVGMIERESKQAKVFLVDNRNVSTLNMLIKNNVEYGSKIYTDSWAGYAGLKKYYTHEIVNHADREFVRGDVHTNTIENLWSYFKRSIRGAHIKISAKYVQLYMNELCWRHNYKNETSMQRFDRLLRSTYQVMCKVSPHTDSFIKYKKENQDPKLKKVRQSN